MPHTDDMGDQNERQPLLRVLSEHDNVSCQEQKIVSFEENDSENPVEWPKKYRWFSVALLCMFAAVVTYTCIGIVPIAGDVVTELKGHKDPIAAVFLVTIWEIGEAMGPLFFAPLSELYGRFVVYNIANVLFIASVVLAALSPSIELLIFARLVTGCAVASSVLNPAIIGDMFPSESRGAAMSAVMLAPLIGGALGPTTSGYIAETLSWRAAMWMCAAIATVIEFAFVMLFQETYPPTILKRRAARKRKETGDLSYTTVHEKVGRRNASVLFRTMQRPARIAWSSSMLLCLSLWGGLMFAFFYVNSTTLPEILDVVYGLSPSKRGLCYLAWSLGSLIAITTCNLSMDRIYIRLTKERGSFCPEARLPLCIVGAFLLPLAVLLYGWTAQARADLFVYLSIVTLLCISMVLSIVPLMTFITDAFGEHSASALTVVLIIRCLLGALLPLLVPQLAASFGYGWVFTVLAGTALMLAPIPCLIMRYGSRWRQRSGYTRQK